MSVDEYHLHTYTNNYYFSFKDFNFNRNVIYIEGIKKCPWLQVKLFSEYDFEQ